MAGARGCTKNNHQDNAHERAADATFPTWCATIAGSNGMSSTQDVLASDTYQVAEGKYECRR